MIIIIIIVYLLVLILLHILFFATSVKKTFKDSIKEYFDTNYGRNACFAQIAFLWPIYLIGALIAVTIDYFRE